MGTKDDILTIIYYFIVLVASVIINITACYIIALKVKKKEFTHLFIASISASNILQTFLGYIPQIAVLFDRNLLNTNVCRVSGFMVFWLVITNIAHITVISIIRTIAMKSPIFYFKNLKSNFFRFGLLLFCYMYGFLWASFPVIGWSKYDIDLDELGCSLDWRLTRSDSLSYIVLVLLFGYFLPGTVITFTLYISKRTVIKRRNSFQHRRHSQYGSFLDRKYLRVCITFAVMFFVLWTPYAVVSMIALSKVLPPKRLVTVAAMFAKLSTISNVIVSCYVDKSFKNHILNIGIKQCFSLCREGSSKDKNDLIYELRSFNMH